jgi:hypothetical protein
MYLFIYFGLFYLIKHGPKEYDYDVAHYLEIVGLRN